MNTTIRAVRTADLPAVYDLLEQSFPEAPRSLFVALTERDVTFRLRHGRVAIVDGHIAGHVRIFARTMLVRGVPVAAGGIGSVATRLDARGCGIATALMRDALGQMRREGMAVSFLFTGIAGFYEQLGYRIVREPSFEADARDAAATPHTGLYAVRAMTEHDVPRLLAIYRRAIAGGTGTIVRTRRTWRDAAHWLAEDAGGCFVAERNGVPVAYLRSRCRTYGHQILEAECAPRHDGAVAALLAAAGQRAAAHRERLVTLAPGDHPLATAIRAITSATETTDVPFPMMARIVSARSAARRAPAATADARGRASGSAGPARPDVARRRECGARRDDPFRRDAPQRRDARARRGGHRSTRCSGSGGRARSLRPRPPADVARRIDALLPETPLRFWNSDRI